MTELLPVKPRTERSLPLLPGWATLLKPVARAVASLTVVSPRASIRSREITSTLAGVFWMDNPRRDPADGAC